MSFAIRTAIPDELPALAAFAERCQADSQRHCAYVSDDATTIVDDVEAVADWPTETLVALDDARDIIGWLLAETDPDMGRVWWWGPFVADAEPADQMIVAVALLRRGMSTHPDQDQHELAFDTRSTLLAEVAERLGFVAAEGSAALQLDDLSAARPMSSTPIVAIADGDELAAGVASLHDRSFPGTHSTGEMLLRDIDREHRVYAAVESGSVIGYVATELQNDGSLYIDFLGVDPHHRRFGIGRDLVVAALRAAPKGCTHAHLSVREGNAGARSLYASLGFTEVRLLAPYRRGFSLD